MTELRNFLDALAEQDVIAWYKLFGAIWTVIAGLTFLALTVYLVHIQIRANRWERHCKVRGGEDVALRDLAFDERIKAGMEDAVKLGWMK
jgi:hypothetical protein